MHTGKCTVSQTYRIMYPPYPSKMYRIQLLPYRVPTVPTENVPYPVPTENLPYFVPIENLLFPSLTVPSSYRTH